MKLIYCPICDDVFKMSSLLSQCCCSASWGRYTDLVNAEYGGEAIPLGIANNSLAEAIRLRPDKGPRGGLFTAFVIPKECNTCQQIKE